ncbi:MAG: hypothetical protein ABIO70_06000 [Pseudomonadota bacterium]
MRAAALLVLPLLATSCTGSRWDGTYQVLVSFLTWDCTGDTVLYDEGYHREEAGLITVQHTAADSMVVSLGDLVLAGTHEGPDFEVSASQGFTDSSCERYAYELSDVFAGSFTADLGIEGTFTVTESMVREGCTTGGETNESCTVVRKISGFLVENDEEQHYGQANWGYTPRSSY